jgi:hypothetical protein
MATTFRSWLPLVVVGAIFWGVSASGGEPAGGEKPVPPKAAPAAPEAKPEVDRTLREQDIYIPYEKLRQVFEKHGRGVFLPYEEFEGLWQAARDKTRPAAEPRPPVGALITEIENEATVAGDVVEVKAALKIDLLTEGWHEIPLRLSDAAIQRAALGGDPKAAPARVLGGANEGHRLLIEKKGKQPESIQLDLQYAKAITRSPGSNSVSIETPQAPVTRWRVRIPQAGVKVNLQPLIAATEVPPPAAKPQAAEGAKPDAAPEKAKPQADETVILAFLGASPTVRIEWTPKAEGATGLSALASVQADQQVRIQEGVVRAHCNLAYAISRAQLDQLFIEVPADYKVVNVFDPNVRQWSVEAPPAARAVPAEPAPKAPGLHPGDEQPATQRITVQLFEPAKAAQLLTVELEKITAKAAGDKLTIPVVKALGVGRQQGFVVVLVDAEMRAEAVRTTGLLQVDAAELPRTLAPGGPSAAWSFAYRYAAVPFELQLSLEPLQPKITVDSLVEARLEPNRLTIDLTAVYNIERAGVFQLVLDRPQLLLDRPEGFEVRAVRGREIPGDASQRAAAVAIHSHHLEGPQQNRLVVNLARKALGRVALAVQFQKDLVEPKLLAPLGPKELPLELPLGLPQVPAATVERATGRLLVYAPESLRVNPAEAKGLRPVTLREALEGIPWAFSNQQPPAAGSQAVPALFFTFSQDPVVLRLSAERKKPSITIRQLLVGRIEEGVIKYQDTLFYSILYSGVKSLELDVPADAAATLHSATPGIQDKRLEPQPADASKPVGGEAQIIDAAAGKEGGTNAEMRLRKRDTVGWSLSGENELLGEGKIELTWEKKLDKLDLGTGVDLVLRPLAPRGVDRSWGQIALTKTETLDIQTPDAPQGLTAIDPQHDLLGEVPGAARAFQFQGDAWTLPFTVTRYELKEVKRTSIDRAVVRMVETPAERVTAVQALYRIRTARQQLVIELPEGAQFDADPLRLNGQPVTLGQGREARQFFVPLLGTTADEPFLLELRYTMSGGGPLALPVFREGPSVEEGPAVGEVYLCLFVPESQALLGTSGPWTPKFEWIRDGFLHWRPLLPGSVTDQARVAWVRQGVKDPGSSADTFHTDGTLYVFSTLQQGPDAPLIVRTVDHRGLSGLVFVVVLLGGLALLRSDWTWRVLAAGGLVALVVLVGAFLPTLSFQIFNGSFAVAVFLVLVMWAVAGLLRLSPTLALAGQAAVAGLRRRKTAADAAAPKAVTADESPRAEPPPEAAPPASSEGGPSHV